MKKFLVSVIALMAAMTLSAQDLTTTYNEAVSAYTAKNYPAAAAGFEKVVTDGELDPEASEIVMRAKKTLPNCYYMMGGRAFQGGDLDEALKNFTKSAEIAKKFGDVPAESKANNWVANVYQKRGGDAFNNKDYAKAAEIFAMGYAANPDNTGMALNLAMSYCESGKYAEGMDIYEAIAAKTHPKYAEDAQKAKEMIALYTNNEVAKMQAAGDFDGIITMSDALLAKNPESALAQNVRLQAYANKKDYAKVIELGEAAAAVQTDPADKSLMYYLLGAAYNAKEMRPQAIAAFKQVTAGPAAPNAQAALAELSK